MVVGCATVTAYHLYGHAGRLPKGYTCMAAVERSSGLCLAVGTAGGQVDFLDVHTAALTASMLAVPDVEVWPSVGLGSCVDLLSAEAQGSMRWWKCYKAASLLAGL